MADVVKSIRARPAPLPPAVGQFGLGGTARNMPVSPPSACPSLEQFEARYLIGKDEKPNAA